MSNAIVVKYRTKADQADANQKAIEKVYAQLAAENPDGVRYTALRMDDGVTFLHVAVTDGDALTRLSAFQEFQQGLGDRIADGPERTPVTLIGSYGFPQP